MGHLHELSSNSSNCLGFSGSKSFSMIKDLNLLFLPLLLLIFFIFNDSNDFEKLPETQSKENFIQPLAAELKMKEVVFQDINILHDEINNFFIQDKLDSLQLDVNVDSSEPEA